MTLYHILRPVVWVFVKLCYFVRYEGKENIPQAQGFIVCPNHNSNLDPFFVAPPFVRGLVFMGKVELFRIPVIGWILRHSGAFPVERGKGDVGAIDRAKATVAAGRSLCIFPEGTRFPIGEYKPFKSGAVVVAAATGADILPVHLHWRGKKLRLFRRVTVTFGEPILLTRLGLTADSRPSEIKRAVRVLRERVAALGERYAD